MKGERIASFKICLIIWTLLKVVWTSLMRTYHHQKNPAFQPSPFIIIKWVIGIINILPSWKECTAALQLKQYAVQRGLFCSSTDIQGKFKFSIYSPSLISTTTEAIPLTLKEIKTSFERTNPVTTVNQQGLFWPLSMTVSYPFLGIRKTEFWLLNENIFMKSNPWTPLYRRHMMEINSKWQKLFFFLWKFMHAVICMSIFTKSQVLFI